MTTLDATLSQVFAYPVSPLSHRSTSCITCNIRSIFCLMIPMSKSRCLHQSQRATTIYSEGVWKYSRCYGLKYYFYLKKLFLFKKIIFILDLKILKKNYFKIILFLNFFKNAISTKFLNKVSIWEQPPAPLPPPNQIIFVAIIHLLFCFVLCRRNMEKWVVVGICIWVSNMESRF